MKTKLSTSFVLFLISLLISLCVIATTFLFHYYNVSQEHFIFLGGGQFLLAMLTPLGIYIAIKSVGTRLNKPGLWGNVFLLIYTFGLMAMALVP